MLPFISLLLPMGRFARNMPKAARTLHIWYRDTSSAAAAAAAAEKNN